MHSFYNAIELDALQLDHTFEFALYFRAGDNYTLYKTAELPFTSLDRDRLERSGVTKLYIRQGDLPAYNGYVEQQLSTILYSPISDTKKSEILFQASSNYINEIFNTPKNISANLDRCRFLVKNIIGQILANPNAIESLSPMVSHNYYTYIHSVQVAAMTIAVINHFAQPSEDDLVDIGMGAILHDFGKVFIPNEVLDKRGKLDADEWAMVKGHPSAGYDYLRHCTDLSKETLEMVLQHHEKFNGRGYPHGYAGMRISPYARAAAVADVYCALTTNRAYRNALESGEALRIMEEEMDGSFDPAMLAVLKDVIQEREAVEQEEKPQMKVDDGPAYTMVQYAPVGEVTKIIRPAA